MTTTPMQMVAMTTALPSRLFATTSPKPTVVSVVTTCGRCGVGGVWWCEVWEVV